MITGTEKAWRRIASMCHSLWQPPPPLNIWQWAAKHVDFSRALNYDTPIHGPYDPDYMPFWKEPAECVTDPTVREITILKSTRAGGSENLLLNSIRYAVAMKPQPTLYVTSDQISSERFMDKRIKRGLRCADETAKALRAAQQNQHDISFPTMDFRVTWPRAKQAFKQDGWALVLCDEVSTWPEYSPDMARRRTDSYPFSHIIFLSSPDPAQRRPSSEDPIFIEYKRGDQRKWRCPDPGGGWFTFELGGVDGPGLKWDASAKRSDGTWDYDKVEQSAYYLTPAGVRLENRDRIGTVRAGRWEATNPKAHAGVRSYHVNAFMTPFKSGDFGHVAVAFLKAKAAGVVAMRTFKYEYLAEEFYGERLIVEANLILERCANYRSGTKISDPAYPEYHELYAKRRATTFCTVDVQQESMYWVIRQWLAPGDSALVAYGKDQDWVRIRETAIKYGVSKMFIDNSYTERRNEVFEQCLMGAMKGAIPTFGRDNLKQAIEAKLRDPYEGTSKQGRAKIPMLTFNPNELKYILSRLISGGGGRGWFLPQGVGDDYVLQLQSEECIDGVWVQKRRDNHFWDCEVMQIAGAMASGYFVQVDELPAIESTPPEPPQPAPAASPRPAKEDAGYSYPFQMHPGEEDED